MQQVLSPVASGTACFNNLYAGNYRIVASDNQGCSVSAEYNVDGPESLCNKPSGDEVVHVSQPGYSDGAIEIAITVEVNHIVLYGKGLTGLVALYQEPNRWTVPSGRFGSRILQGDSCRCKWMYRCP